MGTRGPIPKRSEDRLGHGDSTRDRIESVKRPSTEAPVGPDLMLEDVHPVAAQWYEALRRSPQSAEFFVASDWATALVATETLSRAMHQGGRISSQLVMAWESMASNLLATEADRRRLKIEIERASAPAPEDTTKVSYLDRARKAKSS